MLAITLISNLQTSKPSPGPGRRDGEHGPFGPQNLGETPWQAGVEVRSTRRLQQIHLDLPRLSGFLPR